MASQTIVAAGRRGRPCGRDESISPRPGQYLSLRHHRLPECGIGNFPIEHHFNRFSNQILVGQGVPDLNQFGR
jgi:hypothetical protein